MEISGNQLFVKNKTTQDPVKVGDKSSVKKSEGKTSTTKSEPIKYS